MPPRKGALFVFEHAMLHEGSVQSENVGSDQELWGVKGSVAGGGGWKYLGANDQFSHPWLRS